MFVYPCTCSNWFVRSFSTEATDLVLVLDSSPNMMNDNAEKVKEAAMITLKTLSPEDRVC